MKIRNGFVPNSSSSSFFVWVRDFWTGKLLLTRTQIRKLLKYGFTPSPCNTPAHLYFSNPRRRKKIEIGIDDIVNKKYSNLGYSVSVNQDDVKKWLLQNKISFEAICHYGHENFLYDSKTDELLHAENFGIQLTPTLLKYSKVKNYTKTTGKKWMEEDDKMMVAVKRKKFKNIII